MTKKLKQPNRFVVYTSDEVNADKILDFYGVKQKWPNTRVNVRPMCKTYADYKEATLFQHEPGDISLYYYLPDVDVEKLIDPDRFLIKDLREMLNTLETQTALTWKLIGTMDPNHPLASKMKDFYSDRMVAIDNAKVALKMYEL